MAFKKPSQERFPSVVLTAQKIIETAPHVAYGTAELEDLIEEAFKVVVNESESLGRKREPLAPKSVSILPVLEALGALTIERNEYASKQGAAYLGSDRFSISHVTQDPTEITSTIVELSSDSSYTDGYENGFARGFESGFARGRG